METFIIKPQDVFITDRTNQLSLAHLHLMEAQQKGSLEVWHLERPGYLGGDIKEFGDTRLLISSKIHNLI